MKNSNLINQSCFACAAIVVVAAMMVACWPQAASTNIAIAEESQPAASDADGLVMHEWGTFTSFSGSDGVKLEFRPLVDSDLPSFVLNRSRQAGFARLNSKLSYSVLQRMETPVTYFYTDREREIRARVDFPEGLLTEFYPPVDKMAPAFDPRKSAPVGNSSLDWGRLLLIPENQIQISSKSPKTSRAIRDAMMRRMLPQSLRPTHYDYARETDSALIYSRRDDRTPKQPFAPQGDYFEKFLFYRGLGNFDLPLEMTAFEEDRFQLTNTGDDPVRSLFLVSVDGQQIRFAQFDGIDPGQSMTLTQSSQPSTMESLAAQVALALEGEGLYRKEALAMVKTWRDSWFGEQGTRLFYMLPENHTERLLPLKIEPQPSESVRVMVGRMEIMSPQEEARVLKLVTASNNARVAHHKVKANAKKPFPLPKEILQLGRLGEPALVRIRNISKSPAIRHEASVLLGQLQQVRDRAAAVAAQANAGG